MAQESFSHEESYVRFQKAAERAEAAEVSAERSLERQEKAQRAVHEAKAAGKEAGDIQKHPELYEQASQEYLQLAKDELKKAVDTDNLTKAQIILNGLERHRQTLQNRETQMQQIEAMHGPFSLEKILGGSEEVAKLKDATAEEIRYYAEQGFDSGYVFSLLNNYRILFGSDFPISPEYLQRVIDAGVKNLKRSGKFLWPEQLRDAQALRVLTGETHLSASQRATLIQEMLEDEEHFATWRPAVSYALRARRRLFEENGSTDAAGFLSDELKDKAEREIFQDIMDLKRMGYDSLRLEDLSLMRLAKAQEVHFSDKGIEIVDAPS